MARFTPLPEGRMALAASGGADSTALAFLAKNWCASEGLAPPLALIIDHALRPESADEAALVKARLREMGIVSDILRWEHPPLASRLHHAARRARYQLLLDACRRAGAGCLLLGHQRDDQAETVLMRLAKGSGIDGLAGMPDDSMIDAVRLLRPLLPVARERLAATCDAAGLAYIVDPSNAAQQFARGRLRRVMPLLQAEGLTVERLTDIARRAAEARQALEQVTAGFLAAHGAIDAFGGIVLDRAALLAQPRAIAMRALAAALQAIHAEDYPPADASLASLLAFLQNETTGLYRTLHGCLIGQRKRHVILFREYAAIDDAAPIRPGESRLWDGRWQVSLAPDFAAGSCHIRALGHPPQKRLDALAPGLRRRAQHGRPRSTLPAVWKGDELVAIPFGDPADETQARLATQWRFSSSAQEN